MPFKLRSCCSFACSSTGERRRTQGAACAPDKETAPENPGPLPVKFSLVIAEVGSASLSFLCPCPDPDRLVAHLAVAQLAVAQLAVVPPAGPDSVRPAVDLEIEFARGLYHRRSLAVVHAAHSRHSGCLDVFPARGYLRFADSHLSFAGAFRNQHFVPRIRRDSSSFLYLVRDIPKN